jgi:Na+-transporting NADH:ubiquinone oxidoreductase subunit C
MKKRLFSILYMFLLTLFFTSIVSGVKIYNQTKIETNQRVKLQRIILEVLKMPFGERASDRRVVETFDQRVKEIEAQDRTLYVGYAEDGKTITGYAFPVGGPGFWGPIYGMVAVDPSGTEILGVAFYKHSETPGLGARITEEWFTKQFRGLPLHPTEGKKKIFYLKSAGTAQVRNELDAVTGATGTSRAVEAFLNKELDHFLKDIWPDVKKRRLLKTSVHPSIPWSPLAPPKAGKPQGERR